jgi:bifunctional oligoribonuclease and PAP phosphatase NrnA
MHLRNGVTMSERDETIAAIVEAIRARKRFVLSSHARPDGDAIGSQLAMALALDAIGKQVVLVNRDPVPGPLAAFPGTGRIRVADHVDETYDAAIIMECSSLDRTGVSGLERSFVINIDHHQGNTSYGALNWFDASAAACSEMVYDLIVALGVPLTPAIATHIYVGILTDTGSFHYSAISARTFDICRALVEAGVDPPRVARAVFDSNTLGRLRLFGAVLSEIELELDGRLALMRVDERMTASAGGTYEDTEGLINLPLTVKEIRASVFFKELAPEMYRVSLRSKGSIDVAAVAKQFGGGGHKNASGCSIAGDYRTARASLLAAIAPVMAPGLGVDADAPPVV